MFYYTITRVSSSWLSSFFVTTTKGSGATNVLVSFPINGIVNSLAWRHIRRHTFPRSSDGAALSCCVPLPELLFTAVVKLPPQVVSPSIGQPAIYARWTRN